LVVTRDSGDWDIFAEVEPIDSSNLQVMQGNKAFMNGLNDLYLGHCAI
jgi:hypothetical protein